MRNGCILPFSNKGNLRFTKNYRCIILTAIATKVDNVVLLNYIQPQVSEVLRKSQNGLWKNHSTKSQMQTNHQIFECVRANNLETTVLLEDFREPYDSIHIGKIELALLAYGLSKETFIIMMRYRNKQ